MADKTFKIQIPSDVDGYCLLQCPSCGEKFMLKVEDIEDKAQLEIWCPSCGLVHEHYITDEEKEVVDRLINNFVADSLNDFSDQLERMFRSNKVIKFKKDKPIEKDPVEPIMPEVGDFKEHLYKCCNKSAKIDSVREITGGYCPFCGGLVDGN